MQCYLGSYTKELLTRKVVALLVEVDFRVYKGFNSEGLSDMAQDAGCEVCSDEIPYTLFT